MMQRELIHAWKVCEFSRNSTQTGSVHKSDDIVFSFVYSLSDRGGMFKLDI